MDQFWMCSFGFKIRPVLPPPWGTVSNAAVIHKLFPEADHFMRVFLFLFYL
jgi:hypothetical protein